MSPPKESVVGAVAEVSAAHLDLSRSWPLERAPLKILIGSAKACDWVLPGPNVQPRECLLRWDGQLLIASSFGALGGSEVILEPNAPLRVGALELLLTPTGLSSPARPMPSLPDADETTDLKLRAPLSDEATDLKLRLPLSDEVTNLKRHAPLSNEVTALKRRVPLSAEGTDVKRHLPLSDEATSLHRRLPDDGESTRLTMRAPAVPDDEQTSLSLSVPSMPEVRRRPSRPVVAARMRTTSGEISAVGPSLMQVPPAEATVLIDPTLAATDKLRPKRRRRPVLLGLLAGALLLALLIVAGDERIRLASHPAATRHSVVSMPAPSIAAATPAAMPPIVAVSATIKPSPPFAAAINPARPVAAPVAAPAPVVAAPVAAPAPVVAAPVAAAPVAAAPVAAAPSPSRAAFDRIGAECRPLPPTARATPEEHGMLQLAIEAYQTGRRVEAQQLFSALVCRPEVGPPARFMARLLLADAAPALPKDRGIRTRRLLDETERQLAEHPELWAQSESLGGGTLVNPKLSAFDFKDQPKCNIFIGEMLYRAGFIPPGAPAPGQTRVLYPSVNQMVARAERLAKKEAWDPSDGMQWFDVVPKNAAEPGDLVLIAARDRGDRDAFHTEHGHVEIISDIVYQAGSIKSVSTVGARSHGVKLSPGAGRVFGEKLEGAYQFSQFAMLVRPRMR